MMRKVKPRRIPVGCGRSGKLARSFSILRQLSRSVHSSSYDAASTPSYDTVARGGSTPGQCFVFDERQDCVLKHLPGSKKHSPASRELCSECRSALAKTICVSSNGSGRVGGPCI
jgi:hypothetical protein